MPSEVEICSNALQMLGASPISSFADGTTANGLDSAKLCGNLWPTTRNSILRSHTWKSAKTRVSLSPDTVIPAFGYSHRFVLPSKWLRNVEINGVVSDQVDYEVETASGDNPSKRLLISQSTLNLIYIWENTDTESWDAMLVEAAELAMAAKMAYAITQSTSLRDSLKADLARFMASARSVDGQDQSPAQLGSYEILNARRSLSYNY